VDDRDFEAELEQMRAKQRRRRRIWRVVSDFLSENQALLPAIGAVLGALLAFARGHPSPVLLPADGRSPRGKSGASF
jgi:hypothetical protein